MHLITQSDDANCYSNRSVPLQKTISIKRIGTFLLTFAWLLLSNVMLLGQDIPITVETESGTLGPVPTPPIFQILNDGATQFLRVQTDFITGVTQAPGSDSRVITYSVTFPKEGTYDLYARVRVGAGNANDDSYYYANGFGVKSVTDVNQWITSNNLNAAGSTISSEIVTGSPGTAGINVWKWINMSKLTDGGETPVSFTVPADNLTQTFQIGSRENGLDLDKFVFGLSSNFFTVANLDNGQPGSFNPPAPPYTPTGPPMATGKSKFVGGVYSAAQLPNFNAYWNQVVPENAGKWGSVEATRDVMNWTELDAAYNLAKTNGYIFRFHILIWGNQQPAWIENLPPSEQLEEINEWFAAVASRYPGIDLLEVVNEPLHDPPSSPGNGGGNYINALGGNGITGWDWVIKAFELARLYFPHTTLIMNDYSIINSTASTTQYLGIINLLKQRGLIDAIGEQGHAFTTRGTPASTLTANLNRLAETGLPIYITELDIDGLIDEVQSDEYKRVIPVFWEHPAIKGITLWGYRPGHWRTAQGAYIVQSNGAERPSMVWLKAYIQNNAPAVTPSQTFTVGEDAANNTVLGNVSATDLDAGTSFQNWQITGGSGAAMFAINANTGALALTNNSSLDFESATRSYTLTVKVSDEYTSSSLTTVAINVSNTNDNIPVVKAAQTFSANKYSANNTMIGKLIAEDNDDNNEPGFTKFQNWTITGGTGASIFAINPSTGQIRLNNGLLLILDNRSSYNLWVKVSDGKFVSAVREVVINIANKVTICHYGTTMSVTLSQALIHLLHGDYIGSCSDGQYNYVSADKTTENNIVAREFNIDKLTVYPNPVNNQINIFLGANDLHIKKITLFDMSGRLLKHIGVIQQSNNVVIPRGSLKPGIYLLRMQGERVVTKKVVVE